MPTSIQIDGVQRDAPAMYAAVDGVMREISSRTHAWEKYVALASYALSRVSQTETIKIQSGDDFGWSSRYTFDQENGTLELYKGTVGIWSAMEGRYVSLNNSANRNVLYYCRELVSKDDDTKTAEYTYDILKVDTTYSRGDYLDVIYHIDPDAYPENGEQDGYWYVKIK